MKILEVIIIYLVITVFFGCKKQKKREEIALHPYSFFVAGHAYGKPGVNNIGVHPPFKNKFEFIKAQKFMDFGVFTGDIVWGSTDKNWDEIDVDISELDLPIHFAVGNHEMKNRSLFESRYGETYKSFIHNSDLFIILDPNLDHWNISGNQLEFLKNVLENDSKNVDNIFVFFHQVIWWNPGNEYGAFRVNSSAGRSGTTNFSTEIEPLFSVLPNNTYMFAGDVGAFANGSEFMYHKYENITLIASGMGGEVRDNIVIIDVLEDKKVSFRLIPLNGDDPDSLGKLEDYVLP